MVVYWDPLTRKWAVNGCFRCLSFRPLPGRLLVVEWLAIHSCWHVPKAGFVRFVCSRTAQCRKFSRRRVPNGQLACREIHWKDRLNKMLLLFDRQHVVNLSVVRWTVWKWQLLEYNLSLQALKLAYMRFILHAFSSLRHPLENRLFRPISTRGRHTKGTHF